jgi:uncharacterized protein YydD (DUF2326 family)
MIYRIFSTLPSFKELTFRAGLNVLFADKSPESTSKHTRNGAGKSSTLEIIHFLTAGDCTDDSIFKDPELINFRFGMEFDLAGELVEVQRSGQDPNEILIRSGGDTSKWPVQPDINPETGAHYLTNRNWDRVLGAMMFGLGREPAEERGQYGPTFRNIFAYFVRRRSGGFSEPHLHFVQAKAYTWQVAISFLLGLDWTIPQEWQVVRDSEEEIKKLKAAVGDGDLAEIVGKRAELRSDIATAEAALSRTKARLIGFQVLPDFRSYEEEAGELTRLMGDLSDQNTTDEALLKDLERAIADEKTPEATDLAAMYKEAGVLIPESALRRFEDVRRFHESVVSNRKSYLSGEMESARHRIARRERQKGEMNGRRVQIMDILKSHGALEQFNKLQGEVGRKEAELELLRRRFAAAEKIEQGLTKLKIRRQELLLRLKQDYVEQSENLKRAIVIFEEISSQLYEKPSKFTPTETPNGPSFKIEGQADRSPGIANMQIFCFDMMLGRIMSERHLGPGFLVHDSHIFDPVDSRQVGAALEYAANTASEIGIQYIVTLNSDKSLEFPDDFDLAPYLLDTKLTDASETGGLFGLRFG